MHTTDVIIVGGGQAGLAMSRSLALRSVNHVVLERGRIGERWHSERWRSLNLLTTNAMSALPGLPYAGSEPEAFMSAAAFAAYLKLYAKTIASPVMSGVEVTEVRPTAGGYRVLTSAGEWRSQAVVVATGACETPFRPVMAQALTARVAQLSPSYYREPGQLPDGGVLVVGASSSGAQLAEEIHASGRPVTLAVGDHTRVPRRYRGRDIYAWMETAGILDDPTLEGGNLDAARRQPSLQLVGRPDHRDLDLGVLARLGVRLVGRLAAIDGATATFADDLARTTKASHVRVLRILDRIDEFIGDRGLEAPVADPVARIPVLADGGAMALDLRKEGVRSVVWATGYIRRYPWLKAPILDHRGEIVHRGGVTPLSGLYVIGLTFLRRRRSSFIDGCGLDAEDLAPIVRARLAQSSKEAA
jgi:putative flavoprotein involved in K+ transport